MEYDRYLALLRRESDRLAEAATELDAPVPACPGWTVGEVVRHTGGVVLHKVSWMRLGRRPREGEWESRPPAGADLLEWYRGACDRLIRELRDRGPDAPTSTWRPPGDTVGFWYRRMAHEVTVHRVDVESAFGDVTPVEDDVAVDGVDEVLDVVLCGGWDEPADLPGAGRAVVVRTGDRCWRLEFEPRRTTLSRELGPHDALLSGEPSELYLYLWGRRPVTAVVHEGDQDAVAALRERIAHVT